MKFRVLPKSLKLRNKRVLVRVDWNVPLHFDATTKKVEKIKRTLPLLKDLTKRGAIVFVMTHLGRPKGREAEYSTKLLAKAIRVYTELPVQYLDVDFSSTKGINAFAEDVKTYKNGDIVCLENVRFQPGEEENDPKIVKAYSACAKIFINDAFASCHRPHATVLGLGKALTSYAGPALMDEVNAMSKILTKVKRPYYAFIGGAKLSSKLPVIEQFLKIADKVFIGGAMAHPFFVAKKLSVGKSLIEKETVAAAWRLLKNKKIVLPTDVIVASQIARGAKVRRAEINDVKKSEMIGDIGTDTMQSWVQEIKRAETIVWNGPFGVTELPLFAHGSLVVGKAIAARAKGRPFVVVGGGDTLPVIAETGMQDMVDFVSTGGGAMLEFIAKKGNLPGLKPLQTK
jgi:phosphoglycerate kinase